MTTLLESSVVRIYSNNHNIVGAGFLISQKHILTCAHVVANALGISRNTAEIPDAQICLDFPLLAAKQLYTARVVFWRPVNPGESGEDIAGLELENNPPNVAQPALLVTSDDFWGHDFRVLGFPAKQINGAWASGELRNRLANAWVQLEDVKQQGYALEPGFSGAPIWDEQLQGVAGMVVAAEINRPSTKAAFMIPAKVLCEAWAFLGEQAIPLSVVELESPNDGPVALNSPFYVERPPKESDCYKEIEKPGALIRVKAPWRMGKTSLMERILAHASQKGYLTVRLNFQMADVKVLADLDKFLQWFCVSVGKSLKLSNKLAVYWDEIYGSKVNCDTYFGEYLLAEINQPLVLGLDKVDLMFPYEVIATDFFGLLRAWHDRAKYDKIWKKLRLVIVHSKEVDIPISIHQSPFNVGFEIELPELNQTQVQDLVKQHRLNWALEEAQKLMAMVGGHPYLVRLALYQIARDEITLEQLLLIAPTEEGLYRDHLLRHLSNLEEDPELLAAMKQVVQANAPVMINAGEASKLHSMSLVKYTGNKVQPLCELYRQYFRDRLRVK